MFQSRICPSVRGNDNVQVLRSLTSKGRDSQKQEDRDQYRCVGSNASGKDNLIAVKWIREGHKIRQRA